ncbi:MAG: sigma-70 family RNA polymerase sigma factor [Vicinamibacterales bacterium]
MTQEQEQEAAVLFARAQQGDRAAYGACLVLLTGTLRRYVRSRVGEVPWIDDAVQETLISVHRARHTYDTGRPFAPWFYAIARNRLIDTQRRERRIGSRELGVATLPEPPSVLRESVVDTEAVQRALSQLPGRQRDVIESLKWKDDSVKEIGERLGMSESAVKVTAHRGYKTLRRVLGMNKHG